MNHLLVNCIDESHLDFLSSYYPSGHIKLKAVLPQAGTSAAPFGRESLDEYLKKRTIPLLFAGSIETPTKKWQNLSLDKSIVNLLDDIVDYVLANDCISLEGAYAYVMSERGLQLDREHQQKVYLLLYCSVYRYIWGYCRRQVLETLAKAQVPLTVCSDAGGYLEKYKTITFIGTRPYVQLLFELQKARFSLNTTTLLWSGSSERVFSSMLNGAVTVSQTNHSKDLIDGENCVLYQWRKLDDLPGKLFNLLENPEAIWQIAQNAAKMAEEKHLWLHRAQQVLEMVSIYHSLYNLEFK